MKVFRYSVLALGLAALAALTWGCGAPLTYSRCSHGMGLTARDGLDGPLGSVKVFVLHNGTDRFWTAELRCDEVKVVEVVLEPQQHVEVPVRFARRRGGHSVVCTVN